MIDHRFTLTQHAEHKNLYHLLFRVDMPLDKNYKRSDTEAIIAVCKQQYPELVFDCVGDFDNYQAKFADGQYTSGTVETTQSAHTDFSYVKTILFSLPLGLDDIMAATCSFKKAVPPIQFTVYPAELVDLTPDDFHEIVENMYSGIGLSLRVRAVSWRYDRVDSGDAVYMIQATDYDYI